MPGPNTVLDFWRRVDKGAGCWIWNGPVDASRRYPRISWRRRKISAHRFSWELHNGPIPEGLCVCHHCDNPICVRPDHLFTGTHGDNMRDMFAKGRRTIVRGSHQGQSKLVESDVKDIRRFYANGTTQVVLAAKFSVDQTTISRIVLRQSWQHI